MTTQEPHPRLFTRKEYYDMADMGWFDDARVELLGGEICLKSPPALEPCTRLFTREEYYNMAELGWFGDTRVELIEGEIIEMSPPLGFHVGTVNILNFIFGHRLPPGYFVSIQNPLYLGLISDPQPDVAIVKGDLVDFRKILPNNAALVIEVSESTLKYDRTKKASLYAKAGILDYWIVNLVDRVIEVYREPVGAIGFFFGFNYANKTIYRPGEEITPLFLPSLRIAVNEVLP